MAEHYKTKIVVNPLSANGRTAKHWPEIEKTIREHLPQFDHEFTTGPLDATRITREALRSGYEMIVCTGGDGTINETVNGFFENGEPTRKDAVLGILSMGTGGDFIKTAGIPKAFQESVRYLPGRNAAPCDAGRLTLKDHNGSIVEKYFINITDFGMGGDVVYRVNNTTKVFGGFLTFLIGMFRSQLRYRNQTVELEIDGKPLGKRKIKNVFVANGQYCGGGIRIAKEALLDDGLFDIVIMGDMNALESMRWIRKIYSGDIVEFKNKVEFFRAEKVKACSDERVMIDMDGEQPGMLPMEITILHGAISLKNVPPPAD
jgi:diacylglycerol kinase (ATP)